MCVTQLLKFTVPTAIVKHRHFLQFQLTYMCIEQLEIQFCYERTAWDHT